MHRDSLGLCLRCVSMMNEQLSCQTATIFKTAWDLENLEQFLKVRQSLWTSWKYRFCFAFFVLCVNMKVVKKWSILFASTFTKPNCKTSVIRHTDSKQKYQQLFIHKWKMGFWNIPLLNCISGCIFIHTESEMWSFFDFIIYFPPGSSCPGRHL